MKKLAIFIFLAVFAGVTSCKNTNDKNSETVENNDSETIQTSDKQTPAEQPKEVGFDINTIAISDADLGDFPYFKLPDGYEYTDPDHYHNGNGKGVTMDYDKEYFLNGGIYVPQEGKTFKGHIRLKNDAKDKNFSPLELQKSFDDLIAQMDGVKINNGKGVKSGEKERLEELDPNAYTKGYFSSSTYFDNIHTYIIRKPTYSVWIQHNMNFENAYITILKTKEFENKMSILKSDQIQKDLNETGKVVLHINFDTDKATLKTDGKDAVSEISKVLQSDKDLKIGINGYTDNTGNDAHNLDLSKDRAETVKNAIIFSGVDSNRLTFNGFGSKDPIADNNTEEGKAKNRRVELIKK